MFSKLAWSSKQSLAQESKMYILCVCNTLFYCLNTFRIPLFSLNARGRSNITIWERLEFAWKKWQRVPKTLLDMCIFYCTVYFCKNAVDREMRRISIEDVGKSLPPRITSRLWRAIYRLKRGWFPEFQSSIINDIPDYYQKGR